MVSVTLTTGLLKLMGTNCPPTGVLTSAIKMKISIYRFYAYEAVLIFFSSRTDEDNYMNANNIYEPKHAK